MKLIIDDANVDVIRRLYEYYPVSGVTTNPSILKRAGRKPLEVLKEIRTIVGDGELHVQAVSLKAEGMIDEAHRIVDVLGDKTFVKIPCIKEGYKAIKELSKEGINVTGTVVYSQLQGYMAGLSGAKYVAPYVNRIDKLGEDGIKVACDIRTNFLVNQIPCKVLGASFKTKEQVLGLLSHGVEAATLPPDLIEKIFDDEVVNKAVDAFVSDFEELVGSGNTMKDVL